LIQFLFLTVTSPFSLGVYSGGKLIKSYESQGKASDVLPIMIDEALMEFAPDEIYYSNGPGNHMALKIAFVCLRALSIIRKIPLYGVSPFVFNDGSAIKAFGNSYFVPTLDKISIEIFEGEQTFPSVVLPCDINFEDMKGSNEPLFLLPPV